VLHKLDELRTSTAPHLNFESSDEALHGGNSRRQCPAMIGFRVSRGCDTARCEGQIFRNAARGCSPTTALVKLDLAI
jgi:hypothetical protein